ncbi:MAG: 50S ribosomal protein L1 [Armatimonadetes bacterium]|nr:50S ribosomal protein L1 [Armatimonadota bacterium]
MAKKEKKKDKTSKRYDEVAKLVDRTKLHSPDEAVALLKKTASTKFDESVDLAVRLGIDPKKGEQNVRGITNLPHGTGKSKTVAVLCDGDDVKAAEDAGADFVGEDDLIKKIQGGWKDFDVMLATEGMGKNIGKIGKFLGPKTPNKRNGTVTNDIATAVKEIKAATRVEYRIDKAAIIHLPLGKVSFTEDQIKENFRTAIDALVRAKPSGAKGRYLMSVTVSTTMGPGIKIDPALAAKKPVK